MQTDVIKKLAAAKTMAEYCRIYRKAWEAEVSGKPPKKRVYTRSNKTQLKQRRERVLAQLTKKPQEFNKLVYDLQLDRDWVKNDLRYWCKLGKAHNPIHGKWVLS